jgi:hypothetical protein
MKTGQTVFTQVIARIPLWEFQRAHAASGAGSGECPESSAVSRHPGQGTHVMSAQIEHQNSQGALAQSASAPYLSNHE